MKPKLRPPGTKRLKVKCDILLSTFALKLNLRRYKQAEGMAFYRVIAPYIKKAGAYTRPLFSST
jgi:hypothetical protein